MTFSDPVQSILTLHQHIGAGRGLEPVTITLADRDTRVELGADEDMSNFRGCSIMFDCPMAGG